MSTGNYISIEAEERKIAEARKRIHETRVKEVRSKIAELSRSGNNDKDLATECIKFFGLVRGAPKRKPKVANTNSEETKQ